MRINFDREVHLQAGTYHCTKVLPIVKDPNPKDPIGAIKDIIQLPAGTHFTATGETESTFHMSKRFDFINSRPLPDLRMERKWWKVSTKHGNGYINELALFGKTLIKVA